MQVVRRWGRLRWLQASTGLLHLQILQERAANCAIRSLQMSE
jgi:hypothetical protein